MTNMLFREEYECLIRMNHQNVVKCLGIEIDGKDIVGLVMEQLRGESLSRLIKKYSNIDEIMIQIYIRQMLDGIAYIHSKKIIHR
jgi:serine/threonine protein kinase